MKRAFVIAAFAGLLLGAPSPARACSCAVKTVPEYLEIADAAFLGAVVSEQAGGDGVSLLVRFEVAKVYKGDVARNADVRTPAGSAACGIEFTPGQPYIVFASASEGELNANLCGGTTLDGLALERIGVTPAKEYPAIDATEQAGGSAGKAGSGSRAAPIAAAAAAAIAAVALLIRFRAA